MQCVRHNARASDLARIGENLIARNLGATSAALEPDRWQTAKCLLAVTAAFTLVGCADEQQTVQFIYPDEMVALCYFPIVADQQGVTRAATTLVKTADAPGYHVTEVSATHPMHIRKAWTTSGLASGKKVGIVIMKYDAAMSPVKEDARIYWIPDDLWAREQSTYRVTLPRFEELQEFDEVDRFR